MALTVTFFNFSKRQNSTAVPTSGGTAVSVLLKNETSLNNPVFVLSGARPTDINYAMFDGAYYFIDDIRSIRNNLYEISCSIDILATYRAAIQGTSAFVEFASAGHTDIMDKRIVPLSPVTQRVASGNLLISRSGCYILSVVGNEGCVQYACDAATLQNILMSVQEWAFTALLQGQNEFDILRIGFSQLISQGSALDAVRSCKWIPLAKSDIPTTPKEIFLGNYDTGIRGDAITDIIKTFGVEITIPFTRAGWLRLHPYTDVFVYLPFVGVVNIDNPYMQASDELTINVSVNIVSGEIAYSLMIDSVIIGTYGGNCGASIDFGTTITPGLQIANGVIHGATAIGLVAATAATGGAAALASIGAASTVISAAEAALMPKQTSVGGIQGGVGAGLVTAATVFVLEHGISGEIGNMADVQGLPYFDTALLSSLSGYVQTRGASVGGGIRGVLRDRINGMLDRGIYLE